MFRTQDSDMAGVPGIFGEGQSLWHAISRSMETHYYHITVELSAEGRRGRYVIMVDDDRRLQKILLSQDSEAFVKSIRVVTPAYMNGTDDWEMEPLTRVAVGQDANDCFVTLITVRSGATYHTSHTDGFDQTTLTNLSPIFCPSFIQRPST